MRVYDVIWDNSREQWGVIFRDLGDRSWYVEAWVGNNESVARAAAEGFSR